MREDTLKQKSNSNIYGFYKNLGFAVSFQRILEVPIDIIRPSFAKTGPRGVLCPHDLIHHVDVVSCWHCDVAWRPNALRVLEFRAACLQGPF